MPDASIVRIFVMGASANSRLNSSPIASNRSMSSWWLRKLLHLEDALRLHHPVAPDAFLQKLHVPPPSSFRLHASRHLADATNLCRTGVKDACRQGNGEFARSTGCPHGNHVGNDDKECGIRVGTALETRKIEQTFHGVARHGNVERARYTCRYGFDPAAWCLSLSLL